MHDITRPLPDTHPEFTIIRFPVFTEYRVAHYRLLRDGSGRIVHGTCVWSWVDVGMIALVALVVRAWFDAQEEAGLRHKQDIIPPALAAVSCPILVLCIGTVLAWFVWARCTQVLHESILVFPALGIQLETHHGHPLFPSPLSVTRHFIPLSALEDVIIHEGFRRWNVRYYLAALHRRKRLLASALVAEEGATSATSLTPTPVDASEDIVEVHVAFENILPYFPVLHTVYCDIHEILFPQPSRVMDTETQVETGTKTKPNSNQVDGDTRGA